MSMPKSDMKKKFILVLRYGSGQSQVVEFFTSMLGAKHLETCTGINSSRFPIRVSRYELVISEEKMKGLKFAQVTLALGSNGSDMLIDLEDEVIKEMVK